MQRTLGLLISAWMLCGLARTAGADPQLDEAKRLYESATAAYTIGKFEDALVGYDAAYQLFKSPTFLFNIAQCHFQLKHWDRAEFFFEGYLREVPEAKTKDLVVELIAEARTHLAAEQEAVAHEQAVAREELLREQQTREQQGREQDARLQREADERARIALVTRRPTATPVYERWWFWGIVGVAGASIATVAVVSSGGSTVLPSGSLGTVDAR